MFNCFQRKRSRIAQDHHGLNALPPLRIRDTNHRDGTDRRMRPQNIFNFSWVNVKTARNDHVLGTVHDVEEPVLIASGEITRIQPAMAECLCGLVGLVAIADHHQRPTHTNFTHFTNRDFHALIIQKL